MSEGMRHPQDMDTAGWTQVRYHEDAYGGVTWRADVITRWDQPHGSPVVSKQMLI